MWAIHLFLFSFVQDPYPPFVPHSPKLNRTVISVQLSPTTVGDTTSILSLPVSDVISAGCSLLPNRSVTSYAICAAASISLSIPLCCCHVNLGKGGCPMNFSYLDGLVVIAIGQAVDVTLLSQSMDSLEINTLGDSSSTLLIFFRCLKKQTNKPQPSNTLILQL